MSKVYFTIAGTCFFYGSEFMERGMRVKLTKEPDNEVDKEAIKVEMPGLGKVGYVANSVRTVLGESLSAGRLYDKIGDRATGKVLYIMENGVVCTLTGKIEDKVEGTFEEDEDENEEEEDDKNEDEYKNDAPLEQGINIGNNYYGSDFTDFGSDCGGSADNDFDEVAMMGLMPGIDVGMPGGFSFGGGDFGGGGFGGF